MIRSLPLLRLRSLSAILSIVNASILMPEGAAKRKISSIIGLLATLSSAIQMVLALRKPSQPVMTCPCISLSSTRFNTTSDIAVPPLHSLALILPDPRIMAELFECLYDIYDTGPARRKRRLSQRLKAIRTHTCQKGFEEHGENDAGNGTKITVLLGQQSCSISRRATEHIEQDERSITGIHFMHGGLQTFPQPF